MQARARACGGWRGRKKKRLTVFLACVGGRNFSNFRPRMMCSCAPGHPYCHVAILGIISFLTNFSACAGCRMFQNKRALKCDAKFENLNLSVWIQLSRKQHRFSQCVFKCSFSFFRKCLGFAFSVIK